MPAILTYHSIDKIGSIISTSPEKFRSQMQHLAQSGIKVISLQELTSSIKEHRSLSQSAVVITFDDGFKNFQEYAFPVLAEFGFPAAVFLVTGFCGRNNRWIGQPRHIPSLDLLDWDDIEKLSAHGIEVGAHTVTHPDLSRLNLSQAQEEISRSKAMIQERLGNEVLFFAYPYGNYTTELRRIVEAEFYGACSTQMDFVSPNSDVHSLPRIDMYYFSRNDFFSWINKPKFLRYIQCRSALRSCKRVFRRMIS